MRAALLLAASTALHLWLASRFPLAPDETYYWEWSRHLDWGYYDQGPMVAWWLRVFCLLFGDTVLGIRLGIVVASLLTLVLLYVLARDLFGERIAVLSLVPGVITPLALAGGFIATYDPLVALFWAGAMFFASSATLRDRRWAWAGVGICFGLGLLTKHTMALFAPCLLLFLAARPEQRRWLMRPEPYLALAVGLLVYAPNLWWQAGHDWVTFRHLFVLTGKGADSPALRRAGDFVGSQAALLTPLVFAGLLWALARSWRAGLQEHGGRWWFLASMSAPVLLAFLAFSAKAKVQANWAVCGWLAPPIAWTAWVAQPGRPTASGAARPRWRAGAALYAAAALIACALLSLLIAVPEARGALGIPFPSRWDQMNKLYGGRELGAAADGVVAAMRRQGRAPVAVGAVTYDVASQMAFYMRGQPRVCCLFLGTRANSYLLWRDGCPPPGGDMLIADDRPPDDPQLSPYGAVFARVEPVPEPVPVYRRGLYREPVRTYYLYRCFGYRHAPAVEQPGGG